VAAATTVCSFGDGTFPNEGIIRIIWETTIGRAYLGIFSIYDYVGNSNNGAMVVCYDTDSGKYSTKELL
jgi:hypothetical protein